MQVPEKKFRTLNLETKHGTSAPATPLLPPTLRPQAGSSPSAQPLVCQPLPFSDAGDAEAMAAQQNNFSQSFLFSDGDVLRRQRRGWRDLSRSRGPAHRHLLQVMMLLTLLISRKMIFGENLSFASVAGGGIEVK